MKLIQGGKGDEHVGEALLSQIKESGVLEFAEGDYVVLFDTGSALAILSNGRGPGDVLLTLEKGRIAVMASVYDRGSD